MKKLCVLVILLSLMLPFASSEANGDSMSHMPETQSWHKEVKTGPLQDKVEKLMPGETLVLEAGVHQGPIHIKTQGITIKGGPDTVVSGQNLGSIIVIEADHVTIEGLTLKDSGNSYSDADSGIALRNANQVRLINNKIIDSLFGIDVYSGSKVLIEGNEITSKNLDIGLRGDAIRLWSVTDSEVLNNTWTHSRDVVSWYSKKIAFRGNKGSHSRYSIHCMYSQYITIQNNSFTRNQVGIFLMYGSDFIITNNFIERALGATGMGIGLKETSNILAQNNTINYSAVGVMIDNSPFNKGSRNWFHNNKFAFNGKGVLLSSDLPGGEFKKNIFLGNLDDVDSDSRHGSRSVWDKNTWDKYQGFDRDNNKVGDTAFIIRKYGETLKGTNPKSAFFYATPLFSLLSLIEEVTNFGEPITILEDKNPQL